MGRMIFITGTDTGVGKTVLTGLLLSYLRGRGCRALAMKPFCSGSRSDARLLWRLQEKVLTLDEVNPFYFKKPLAPAAAGGRKNVSLDSAFDKIVDINRRCDLLLIEGIGGVMVPLGKNYTVADLIGRLECPAVVVAANRLGAINHTALTLLALQAIGINDVRVVMAQGKNPGLAAQSNPAAIRKMLSKIPLFVLPHLELGGSKAGKIKNNALFLKKTLARIVEGAILSPF